MDEYVAHASFERSDVSVFIKKIKECHKSISEVFVKLNALLFDTDATAFVEVSVYKAATNILKNADAPFADKDILLKTIQGLTSAGRGL